MMVLKVVPKHVNGIQVRVPVLVNVKDLNAGDQLVWDKTTSKTLNKSKSILPYEEAVRSAKKRMTSM